MEKKKSSFDLKKSCQWMLYIDLVLPTIMFLLAWFMGDNDMGKFFSGLFHAYNIYIMNPIPAITKGIGIVGILLPLALLAWAIKRKDYVDLVICIGIEVLVVIYFWLEWNYVIVRLLNF